MTKIAKEPLITCPQCKEQLREVVCRKPADPNGLVSHHCGALFDLLDQVRLCGDAANEKLLEDLAAELAEIRRIGTAKRVH